MLDTNSLLLILQASSFTVTLSLAIMLGLAKLHQPDTSRAYEQMRLGIIMALLLMSSHYFLQIHFGFRAMGADAGALINILFYSLSIYTFSFSFIRLGGRPSFQNKFLCVATISMLIIIASAIGGSMYYGSIHMPVALYIMGATFFFSILFCLIYPAKEINRMIKLADEESGYLPVQYQLFLKTSSRLLYIAALVMSLSIYFTPLVFIVGTLNLLAMLFFIVSFIALGFNIGSVSQIISPEIGEHKNSAGTNTVEETKPTLTDEQKDNIARLISSWRNQQGYGASDLNSTTLATRLDLPKRQLVQYLREVEGKTFRIWLSDLRLEEAKRLILAHPEFGNETIAESCGFSRTYFQAKFKETTGLTPDDWRLSHGLIK